MVWNAIWNVVFYACVGFELWRMLESDEMEIGLLETGLLEVMLVLNCGQRKFVCVAFGEVMLNVMFLKDKNIIFLIFNYSTIILMWGPKAVYGSLLHL